MTIVPDPSTTRMCNDASKPYTTRRLLISLTIFAAFGLTCLTAAGGI